MSEPYRHGGFEVHELELASPFGQIVVLDAKIADDEDVRGSIGSVLAGGDGHVIEELAKDGQVFGAVLEYALVSVRLVVGRIPDEERPQRARRSVRNLLLRVPSGKLLVAPVEAFDPREEAATHTVTVPPGDHRLECWELDAPPQPRPPPAPKWHTVLQLASFLAPIFAALMLRHTSELAAALALFSLVLVVPAAFAITRRDSGRTSLHERSGPLVILLETSPSVVPGRGGTLEPEP